LQYAFSGSQSGAFQNLNNTLFILTLKHNVSGSSTKEGCEGLYRHLHILDRQAFLHSFLIAYRPRNGKLTLSLRLSAIFSFKRASTLCPLSHEQTLLDNVKNHNVEDVLQNQLKTAANFESWRSQAQRLDE